MASLADLPLVLLVLSNLALLGSTHLGNSIRLLGVQGVCLGLLVALVGHGDIVATAALAAGVLAGKGLLYPWVLLRVQRKVKVERDSDPLVPLQACYLAGILALAMGFWVAPAITPHDASAPALAMPVALATIFAGLTLTVTRRKALAQVVGYVVLENGIFLFALTLVADLPLLLELGALLEVFFAVFVMGIAVGRISREFATIDVDRLDQLRG
jgi:hydrogenase-4 component E